MLKFSIIVPTYNEEKDIRQTLKCLLALDYANKEILIIDDSTDNTPAIVREYESENLKLIRPAVRKGRCEARNLGIRESTGDVLVILNADVLLPDDFLDRIKIYYDQGYDSVSVMNEIANQDELFARYIQAKCNKRIRLGVYRHWDKIEKGLFWTEGFSVRKSVAMQTDLFPSGFAVPLVAGEDARFADALRAIGCKGKFDEHIVVPHIAPGTFAEFWQIRKGRGAGTPAVRHFLDQWPLKKIQQRMWLKAVKRLLNIGLIFPVLYQAFALARNMPRQKLLDTIRFAYVLMVEDAAVTVGEFNAFHHLQKKMRHHENQYIGRAPVSSKDRC